MRILRSEHPDNQPTIKAYIWNLLLLKGREAVENEGILLPL